MTYLRLYYKSYYFKRYNNKINHTGYLFEGNQGAKHISSCTVVNYFTEIKGKYKLDKNITFHSFRHSFITRCQEKGIPLVVIQAMVGHIEGSSVTNDTYTSVSLDFMKQQIKK